MYKTFLDGLINSLPMLDRILGVTRFVLRGIDKMLAGKGIRAERMDRGNFEVIRLKSR